MNESFSVRTSLGVQNLLPSSPEGWELLPASESLPLSLPSVPLAPRHAGHRVWRDITGRVQREAGALTAGVVEFLKAAGRTGKWSRKVANVLQEMGTADLGLSPRFPPGKPQRARP